MTNDLLEGAANAAAYMGLNRRKIYRLVDDGHLPHVKKGRRLFFRKSELDRAFRACCEGEARRAGVLMSNKE